MSQYDVYIAGSMTGRLVGEVLAERRFVRGLLDVAGLTYYDPALGEGLERRNPQSTISNAFDQKRMNSFVKKDLGAVAESRAILNINGDMISDGACWEMAYAVFYRHTPVHIVAPKRYTKEKMGFTNILVDGIHKDLGKAIKAVKKAVKEA